MISLTPNFNKIKKQGNKYSHNNHVQKPDFIIFHGTNLSILSMVHPTIFHTLTKIVFYKQSLEKTQFDKLY